MEIKREGTIHLGLSYSGTERVPALFLMVYCLKFGQMFEQAWAQSFFLRLGSSLVCMVLVLLVLMNITLAREEAEDANYWSNSDDNTSSGMCWCGPVGRFSTQNYRYDASNAAAIYIVQPCFWFKPISWIVVGNIFSLFTEKLKMKWKINYTSSLIQVHGKYLSTSVSISSSQYFSRTFMLKLERFLFPLVQTFTSHLDLVQT